MKCVISLPSVKRHPLREKRAARSFPSPFPEPSLRITFHSLHEKVQLETTRDLPEKPPFASSFVRGSARAEVTRRERHTGTVASTALPPERFLPRPSRPYALPVTHCRAHPATLGRAPVHDDSYQGFRSGPALAVRVLRLRMSRSIRASGWRL
jgi:hypothetical protein